MMKTKNLWLYAIISICMFIGCSKHDEEPEIKTTWKDSELARQLAGTSWQLYSVVTYNFQGDEVSRDDYVRQNIFHLTDRDWMSATGDSGYRMEEYNPVTNEKTIGFWWLNNDEFHCYNCDMENGLIVSNSSHKLSIRIDENKEYTIYTYSKVSEQNDDEAEDSNPSSKDSLHTEWLRSPAHWDYQFITYDANQRKNTEERIRFTFNNQTLTMSYAYLIYSPNGYDINASTIFASGTFLIRGNKLECDFTNISVDANDSNEYMGWVSGSSKSEIYGIEFKDNKTIYITTFGSKKFFKAECYMINLLQRNF